MKNKGMFKDKSTLYVLIIVVALLVWRNMSGKINDPDDSNNGEKGKKDPKEETKDKDLYTVVKTGSKGTAVTKCQQRANTIISFVKSNLNTLIQATESTSVRMKYNHIATLSGLKTDGVFGPKTLNVIKTITDKESTNLYTLRIIYNKYYDTIHTIKPDNTPSGNPWFDSIFGG